MSIITTIVIRIMGRLGASSIIHTITIDTMINFNGGNNGHGLKIVTCKQTLTPNGLNDCE